MSILLEDTQPLADLPRSISTFPIHIVDALTCPSFLAPVVPGHDCPSFITSSIDQCSSYRHCCTSSPYRACKISLLPVLSFRRCTNSGPLYYYCYRCRCRCYHCCACAAEYVLEIMAGLVFLLSDSAFCYVQKRYQRLLVILWLLRSEVI